MTDKQKLGSTTENFEINILGLDTITLETLTIYAKEQCFTMKEAIVNLIKYGLRDVYGNDVLN